MTCLMLLMLTFIVTIVSNINLEFQKYPIILTVHYSCLDLSRSADSSAKKFFTFIIQSSGLALVPPLCFARTANWWTITPRCTRTGHTTGTPHCHCYAVSPPSPCWVNRPRVYIYIYIYIFFFPMKFVLYTCTT